MPAEKAKKLPRVFYKPSEISAMIGIEYRRVMTTIHAGEIPAEKFGRIYRVPAWWVNKHLTGVSEDPAGECADGEQGAA
jgi:excisionase family DNA binding protein